MKVQLQILIELYEWAIIPYKKYAQKVLKTIR